MANDEHPSIKLFRNALQKRDLTKPQVDEFDRWRNNEKKCVPGSAIKAQADALWEQYVAVGPAALRGAPAASKPAHGGPRGGHSRGQRREPPRDSSHDQPRSAPATGASARVLGEPFHNPYTFIPFGRPERRRPTPLTIDEIETDRITGVLELQLRTLTPLLSCDPRPRDDRAEHKVYRALVSGPDVIVPATGVRGALRTLLTILTGGTLGYVDPLAWLVQGRDATLGPQNPKRPIPELPKEKFLAQVVRPGGVGRSGTVRLGETRLIRVEALGGVDRDRPSAGKRGPEIRCDEQGRRTPNGEWLLRLSGRPVNPKGKREGLFRASGPEIALPAELWEEYMGRHRHADIPELRRGDLVWLEPNNPECVAIGGAGDVRSIQWARWGRRGERLLDEVMKQHSDVIPDALRADGLVDAVTDLFGQIPLEPGAATAFAARVRPENLVFQDAANSVQSVPLAPLAPPHPGCGAFYRDARRADEAGRSDRGLRGYKVYRTQRTDRPAPWLWETQGVYDDTGATKSPQQRVNKTCELVPSGREGTLRISFRALNRGELALLLAACTVDWRLGGGKPLGLGLCRVVRARVVDESGAEVVSIARPGDELAELTPDLARELSADTRKRLLMWQASQRPVEKLRYPRAVVENSRGHARGGHAWFSRHAQPQKGQGSRQHGTGLQPVWLRGELATAAGSERLDGQVLPPFNFERPEDDVLFGYDIVLRDGEQRGNRQTHYARAERFEAAARKADRPDAPQGPNRDSRANAKRGR